MRFSEFLAGLAASVLFWGACSQKLPPSKPPLYSESFDRPDSVEIGPDWLSTAPAGVYRIEGGVLSVRGAHNHPLWLKRELPTDAVIEFDAWSDSPDGDIKAEAFGDGHSYAISVEYTSTGYVFIHGGWRNQLSALCRLEEHGEDRKTRADLVVVPGKHYHYLLARHGGHVEWYVDGVLALTLEDPAPLSGAQHKFFGFDNWETSVHFDNLVIRPY
jgi:hypothetical protein